MSFSVGDVAAMTGVTVRLLHHYDEVGLCCPSGRSDAGYRQYDSEDVARLRRVLTYRELGFSLDEIAVILDDPRADAGTHLRRQHHLLTERIHRLQEMVSAVERALEDHAMSTTNEAGTTRVAPTPEQQMEPLGEVAFPDEWAEEVVKKSGDSEELAESSRRIAEYTTDDWRQIMTDEMDICRRLAAAMAAGLPPQSSTAMDLAEEHRNGLRRWFFDCTPALHVAFADTFDTDERMRASFEGVAAGLTAYLHDAIVANADRSERSGLS